MRGIITCSTGTIGDAEKFFRRTSCAKQRRLAWDFIIGEQAARPGCLAARRGRRIHSTADFLAHFCNGGQQGRAKYAMRSAKCGDLALRFLPRLLFGFECGTKLAKRRGKTCAGCLDGGWNLRIAAQQRIQAVFCLARPAPCFRQFQI